MNDSATMLTGPLGSTVHVLRADAGTIAELAAIDWNRYFPPGLPRPGARDHHPDGALASARGPDQDPRRRRGRRGECHRPAPRRGSAAPVFGGRMSRPGTGMEPDCTFYVGERARGYYAALAEGETVLDAYVERIAPDLVVEVEITHADKGKAERYGQMGVRELWRLHGRKESWELRVEFLALTPGSAPRNLDASEVLEGLTPDDVCEAVEGVRLGQTRDERAEAVARIVHRRQGGSVRVSEEAAPYHASL